MEPVHVSTGVLVRELTPCGDRGDGGSTQIHRVPLPKVLCPPTHHHKVELTANAAQRLKNEGDPGHLPALCVLQHRAQRAGDSVGTLLALPHMAVSPLLPGDTLAVPTSPEAGHHQREDHEVAVRGSGCCVNVIPGHLPACRDTVALRGDPGCPRRGQGGDSALSLPAMPLYSKLMPLSTVVSMLGGRTFHHLYSKPSAGSVPSGHLRQPGDRRQEPCTGVAPTSRSVSLACPAHPWGPARGREGTALPQGGATFPSLQLGMAR